MSTPIKKTLMLCAFVLAVASAFTVIMFTACETEINPTPPLKCECDGADDCICDEDDCECENCQEPGGPTCPPHTYGAWIINPAATCTTAGVRTRTCSRCQYVDSETIAIIPDAHNAGPWDITEADCTTAGKRELHCTLCNVLLESGTIDALDHDWEWKITLEPTETAAGSRTETCTRCGATSETEIIPQLPGPSALVSITLPGTVETMGTNTFCKSGTFTANQPVTWSISGGSLAGGLEGTSINAATGALTVNIADHGKTVTITATSPTNPSNSASVGVTVVSCLPSDFYGEWFMERTFMFGDDFTVIINAGSFKFIDSSDGYVDFSINGWTAELNARSSSSSTYPAGYYLSVTATDQVDNLYTSLAAYILLYLNNNGQKLMNYIEDTYDREHEKVN